MAGKLTWVCRYCGARTKTSADTWPELRPEPNGHVHKWDRALRGRPHLKPVDEPTADVAFGDERVDPDDLDGFGGPVDSWVDRRRGRKR